MSMSQSSVPHLVGSSRHHHHQPNVGNVTNENKLPDIIHRELMMSKMRRRRFEELTQIFDPHSVENQTYTNIRRSIKPSM